MPWCFQPWSARSRVGAETVFRSEARTAIAPRATNDELKERHSLVAKELAPTFAVTVRQAFRCKGRFDGHALDSADRLHGSGGNGDVAGGRARGAALPQLVGDIVGDLRNASQA